MRGVIQGLGFKGLYRGIIIGLVNRDTRTLDYGPYG